MYRIQWRQKEGKRPELVLTSYATDGANAKELTTSTTVKQFALQARKAMFDYIAGDEEITLPLDFTANQSQVTRRDGAVRYYPLNDDEQRRLFDAFGSIVAEATLGGT